MKKILKYPINFGRNVLKVHKNSLIRHFGIQDGHMYIWAEIEYLGQETEERVFYVYGTGDPIEGEKYWSGTCFENDGEYVWHLYEELL